jgi:hypothetical protein
MKVGLIILDRQMDHLVSQLVLERISEVDKYKYTL